MEIFRRMTPAEKLALVEDANRAARALALARLPQRCPEATPEELRRRLMGLLLGERAGARRLRSAAGRRRWRVTRSL